VAKGEGAVGNGSTKGGIKEVIQGDESLPGPVVFRPGVFVVKPVFVSPGVLIGTVVAGGGPREVCAATNVDVDEAPMGLVGDNSKEETGGGDEAGAVDEIPRSLPASGLSSSGSSVGTGGGTIDQVNGAFDPLAEAIDAKGRVGTVGTDGTDGDAGEDNGAVACDAPRKTLCVWTGSCGTLKTDRIITPLIAVNSPHKEGGFCLERVLGECLRPEL
jgi:hypothetical protein